MPCAVSVGAIEDAHHTMQADFANQYIGGGVLEGGNVQEEIRFTVCPELLVSMLVCEVMDIRESIVLVGAQQFAKYKGYGGSFQCAGPEHDVSHLDESGSRRDVRVVALDALCFPGHHQYELVYIMREVVKATVAFQLSRRAES